VQNGGMVRNGFKETGLMNIKNGLLITIANGIIGRVIHRYENICVCAGRTCTCSYEPHSIFCLSVIKDN